VLLRGVDRGAFAVAFVERLRGAGVTAGLTEIGDLVRGLDVAPPLDREGLYWTVRVAVVRRRADLEAFDRVFAAVFADAPPLPLDRSVSPAVGRRDDVHVPVPGGSAQSVSGAGLPWATLPPAVAEEAGGDESGLVVPQLRASDVEALAARPFDELDERETALLGEVLRRELERWPTRRTRRYAAAPTGRRVSLRSTMTRARRTAWEPVSIVRERPVRRPRRVVMLCDVSESMRAQATAYLHLMRAFATVTPAEVFAFATSLTRLTAALSHRSALEAVAQASAAVSDRFGGTRIATNIGALLRSHHGNAVRGALVVIASDGWDSDPPELLAAEMARLSRRAHAVLWLNPRAGVSGFEPRVASMAAALPYCSRLLPAATFGDLLVAARALQKPGN
jgi:uncharacterized protein with von Willebrand factor type A (vWA) domain